MERPSVPSVPFALAGLASAGLRDARRVTRSAADRAGTRALDTGTEAVGRLISGVLNHPSSSKLLDQALAEPGLERLLTQVLDSPLMERMTARWLDSEEMQLVIEHVAASQEVRAAWSSQTAGLAEDVTASVRARTASADAASERVAQHVIRRLRGRAGESSAGRKP